MKVSWLAPLKERLRGDRLICVKFVLTEEGRGDYEDCSCKGGEKKSLSEQLVQEQITKETHQNKHKPRNWSVIWMDDDVWCCERYFFRRWLHKWWIWQLVIHVTSAKETLFASDCTGRRRKRIKVSVSRGCDGRAQLSQWLAWSVVIGWHCVIHSRWWWWWWENY